MLLKYRVSFPWLCSSNSGNDGYIYGEIYSVYSDDVFVAVLLSMVYWKHMWWTGGLQEQWFDYFLETALNIGFSHSLCYTIALKLDSPGPFNLQSYKY